MSGGTLEAENGNMYTLTLVDGEWMVAFNEPDPVSVTLGTSGTTVTIGTCAQLEEGCYRLRRRTPSVPIPIRALGGATQARRPDRWNRFAGARTGVRCWRATGRTEGAHERTEGPSGVGLVGSES